MEENDETKIEKEIDKEVGEVRTEALDMSFGEIVNLHDQEELIIDPEYQRLFRWSEDQQSKLIESVLLELPVPQIFVIENPDGVFELIDGLQRISTVIRFINPDKIDEDPLELDGCELINGLNGQTFDDLPLRLRLRIKRSAIRMVVIKRQSKPFLKYEMFQRLNTGGSILEPQEIRNCSARMLGEAGIRFYDFLKERADEDEFKACTSTISDRDREQKGDEELVLRFYALKNGKDLFKGHIRDWLDNYMEGVLLDRIEFDYEKEKEDFSKLFGYLADVMGENAFVKFRDNRPIGGLSPAYFEGVSVGTFKALDEVQDVPEEEVREKIISTVQTDDFQEVTGPAANTRKKLDGRISIIEEALLDLTQ